MVEQWFFRILLAPVSLLYGLFISLRNIFYETGLLKSAKFNLPVISVGNLSIGGAGKTPHIEYLVSLLGNYISVGTLSRGYKRKTKGFKMVQRNDTALTVGDEPLQYKTKYPAISVAVSESRTLGVPKMLSLNPNIQTILLDDAYQHRSVKPGLNILLTEFDRLFTQDYLLPSGRLREWRSAYKRADIIIISKCPSDENDILKNEIEKSIKPIAHQRLFYSYYHYLTPYYIFNANARVRLDSNMDIILISAIANTQYLMDYLDRSVASILPMQYEDHHLFTNLDLSQLNIAFTNLEGRQKLILTTEKDATRLFLHREFILQNKLPIFVLPVEVKFHFGEGPIFDQLIKNYLLNFKS